jgi:RNA polymerase sigma factor (sigma-70 family)
MDMALDDGAGVQDAELLALYARGDRAAARSLTLRFTPLALRVAARMLGDGAEAEDVAQEAMLRLWRVASDWREGEAKVSTWLYRVTVNLCTDRLRRRRPLSLDEAGDVAEDRPGVLSAMIETDRQATVQRTVQDALARLPERQRQAVVLRHLEGLGNPEIADVMGIGVEAVESLTARGKRALAAALAGRRDELGFDDE